VIEALRELANTLDDHGRPSMSVDHMRLEVCALKARLPANDNTNQPGQDT
jgi:hypothetical protein